MLNGLPHGYGRTLFQDDYNEHPDCSHIWGQENLNYTFYEGNFEQGFINGTGMLLMERDNLIVGEF
eukprot:CAMPEP_0116872014 /NCGR_PEP_ID=MMETSP0463-20121206/2628_1 /TAXON_ID=181622 /ORGANISM="Strombidinopsis sp, Strain SopsisLIS2011" /LENGTH=65 /DNA_ID=CAMNT_0004511539 /DNA_START=1107 /DNA_END=1304 /DNA_ORIENTATION=-